MRRPIPRAVAAALLLAGCREPTVPVVGTPGIHVVGAIPSDTVEAVLSPPLTVEVRDADGRLAPGVTVTFQPVARTVERPGWPYGPEARVWIRASESLPHRPAPLTRTTDPAGRATVQVRLGRIAGLGELAVSVPELGMADTIALTIRPGQAVRIAAEPRDSAVYVGGSYGLRGGAEDRHENPRQDPITFTAASGPVQVEGTVLRGTGIGRGRVVARSGAVADTVMISVIPAGTLAVRDLRLTALDHADRHAVSLFELDGSGTRAVIRERDVALGRDAGLGWSPSGDHLLAAGGDPSRLYRLNPDGSFARLYTPPGAAFDFAPAYAPGMEWVYFSRAPRGSAQEYDLFRARPDGTGVQRLTPEPTEWFYEDRDPTPSPDGRRVAYTSNRDRSYAAGRLGNGYLRVLDLQTRSLTKLNLEAYRPRWSPDGEWIAFVDGGHRLAIVRPDGTGRRTLGTAYFWAGVSWSPDGQWVVAALISGGLALLSVDGAHELPLAYAENLFDPAWRP